jgi:uncharacterized repeat protein (TIGR03943 family)
VSRAGQAVLLFLLGASVLHAGATDLALRYVKAGLRPALMLCGAVLIAAAAATAWYGRREPEPGHGVPRVSWLLLLPLLALILLSPPAPGAHSAMRSGTALTEPLGYPPLPAGEPLRLGLADYAGRAAYDGGRTLSGRRVRLTGFVALDGSGTPYLVRMTLNCCAADARPVKVGLTGRVPPVLEPDLWLEVTGTYTPKRAVDPVNQGPVPFLDVVSARPVPAPGDPYDSSAL